jgi:DNA-directed RNA polymerase subunit RPC12/RpoP
MVKLSIVCDCGNKVEDIKVVKEHNKGNFDVAIEVKDGVIKELSYTCSACGDKLDVVKA